MKVCFLLDEHLSPRLKTALLRLAPTADVLRVGDPSAPALGTLDPELLRYLEISQRMLVTANRASMPAHIGFRSDIFPSLRLLRPHPRIPLPRRAQLPGKGGVRISLPRPDHEVALPDLGHVGACILDRMPLPL
ncbi:MAG: hypothetical protein FJ011_03630 [Chloroflexi bacterium]|nr:hypothetical protein [Chloroflexota bacterium]